MPFGHICKYMDIIKALAIKQPFAQAIIDGQRSIEIRRNTEYRGDVLIIATKRPEVYGLQSGCSLGIVELYDTKPVQELTAEEWRHTRVPLEKRESIKNGTAWLFRNPRKVVEFPLPIIRTGECYARKDFFVEYPEIVDFDEKAFEATKSAN